MTIYELIGLTRHSSQGVLGVKGRDGAGRWKKGWARAVKCASAFPTWSLLEESRPLLLPRCAAAAAYPDTR